MINYQDEVTTLYNLDCRNAMLPDDSIDTIITDPPYGLEFMGKEWDRGVPGKEFWEIFLRAAKPGAFLLAFGGTRTYHRMACAIEDAGWELRDCIMWIYGSGFPKSLDIGKAFDKTEGVWRGRAGAVTIAEQPAKGTEYERTDKGEPVGEKAKLWNGWGTALKPAYEPIIVAMKPLQGTYVNNALAHGVAGLNIDGCRVPASVGNYYHPGSDEPTNVPQGVAFGNYPTKTKRAAPSDMGRWPANIIHDGSEEIDFPASRFFYCAKASTSEREAGCAELPEVRRTDGRTSERLVPNLRTTCRKNHHPTVKPIALMEYLCRLTSTPTGGVVYDPFTGSGTTGIGAKLTGRKFIGCELSPEYCAIASARISKI